MILILANGLDQQAHSLAQRWGGTVLTPADLSQAGWHYELPQSTGSFAVASGRKIPVSDITGVLTRISCITERDLPDISDEDRSYVAAEMHAFLTAWLDSLDCPVLNRPTASCLCGPSDRLPSMFDDEGDGAVVVVGDRCFGAADSRQSELALGIARQAGVELISVRFRNGKSVDTSLIPDLSREDAAAAVFERLTSGKRAPRHNPARKTSEPGKSLILLWGLPADGPLGRVYEELLRIGAPVRLLDQRDVLDTNVCCGQVRVRDQSFSLEEVKSVYLRFYDSTQLPHVLDSSEKARGHAADIDLCITRWLRTTSAFVVSPLDAMSVNNSKPYQSRWIAHFGWRIPATLIATDPDAVRAFWKRHGEVIYKSISSIRSRVSRLTPEHDLRFDNVTACPTQFQEFIPGIDHRVHVVGNEVFACQVLCDADDYRYSGEREVEYLACQLPVEIEERCRRMSAAMGLPVSGIDLRLTPESEWVCFEVNPSPAFTAYEDMTGQPITAAVARLLLDSR